MFQKDFHLKIIKKRATSFLFCPTKMDIWSDICPFKKEKLFAALHLRYSMPSNFSQQRIREFTWSWKSHGI